jgi:transposase
MFIRQTKTRGSIKGESYFTYRLVTSERVGSQVRQKTLLNLGSNFPLSREKWPALCACIERHQSGQVSLVLESAEIEKLAAMYAGRLLAASPAPVSASGDPVACDYQEVDTNSLELSRPRSVGVEHVGLSAMSWLGFDDILSSARMNRPQRMSAIGSIIGRMALPASEDATFKWLKHNTALGELLEFDFETMSAMRLYRASDQLIRNRELIEQGLFSRIEDMFSLETTVTLYDLTNTYFEGDAARNSKAKHGHSKEKRSDCPLVTLGIILDGSGFIRRSKMFEGSVAESTTLEGMLKELNAPQGALVIMDRGIATKKNIVWLKEHEYRYLVVSRERNRQFDETDSVQTLTAQEDTIKLQRVLSSDGQEVRLYCYSEGREKKDVAITGRFAERFEKGLTKIGESLTKPHGEKKFDKITERIGRLKEKSRGIAQHYEIELTKDESGKLVTAIAWQKVPKDGTAVTHPGVYCLRSNETSWDEAKLWHTYTMLTDLESVFRSLKSELGLRPIFHHKEERTEGHLFITVLAYQFVQVIRRRLKNHGNKLGWPSLRNILSVQQRVTATFKQKDGRTLNIRKSTKAESDLHDIYTALDISTAPGGIKKLVV